MTLKPKRRWIRLLEWILLLILFGAGLQHIPGTYTIDDFQDDYELTSPEGIALLALSDASLSGEVYFEEAVRHRISRNAEIEVPAGSTLRVQATTVPYVEKEEVILKPATLKITSDKPLTFIYRFVTVATAQTLRIQEGDPEMKVKAIGQYKLLSALATAHRYQRQKTVRRDYKIPTRARMDFKANFRPEHEIQPLEGVSLLTGTESAKLELKNAVWEKDSWQEGDLQIFIPIADPAPTVNQLLESVIPSEIELGGSFAVKLERFHSIQFSENFLELYVDGRFNYAKSKKITGMFNPSFTAHLGIQFHLPEQTLLQDAQIGVELTNIYSLDFNRSNPMFDKMARGMVRKYRDEAAFSFNVREEAPEILQLPGDLFVDSLMLRGNEEGNPVLILNMQLTPKSQPLSPATNP